MTSLDRKLSMRYCFGLNPGACSNVIGLRDERLVLYVCGAQVVVYNTETRDQSFLQGGRQGITCITQARNVVAVAERGDPAATVTLHELGPPGKKSDTMRSKKRVLSFAEYGSPEIRSVGLSYHATLCVTLGCGPDWPLVLWNIEKSPAKCIHGYSVPVGEDSYINQVLPSVVLYSILYVQQYFVICSGLLLSDRSQHDHRAG
jgi:hypothetical protein